MTAQSGSATVSIGGGLSASARAQQFAAIRFAGSGAATFGGALTHNPQVSVAFKGSTSVYFGPDILQNVVPVYRPQVLEVASPTNLLVPPTEDNHVRRGQEEYSWAFQGYLPQGIAWPRWPDSVLMQTVNGLAGILGYCDSRAADLLERESDPRQTVEMLDWWERAWGLPDPCYAGPSTIGERQNALVLRMTLMGGQSRQFFIDTAAFLDYDISITEYRPFMVGIDGAGDNRTLYQSFAIVNQENFTAFDPGFKNASATLSNNNLTVTCGAGINTSTRSVLSQSTSKLYAQFTCNLVAANCGVGICNSSQTTAQSLSNTNNAMEYFSDGNVYVNGGTTAIGSFTTGDVIDMAVDLVNKRAWFRKNGGNWNANPAANPTTNVGGISIAGLNPGPWYAASECRGGAQFTANFGQVAYAHAAPSGYVNWFRFTGSA